MVNTLIKTLDWLREALETTKIMAIVFTMFGIPVLLLPSFTGEGWLFVNAPHGLTYLQWILPVSMLLSVRHVFGSGEVNLGAVWILSILLVAKCYQLDVWTLASLCLMLGTAFAASSFSARLRPFTMADMHPPVTNQPQPQWTPGHPVPYIGTGPSGVTEPSGNSIMNGGDWSRVARVITHHAVPARHGYAGVIGMGELKIDLLKAGQEIVRNQGARNGILLHGDPGNGKTFFAEALAGELRLPFLSVSFGDMASKWIGQTTEQAMKIFDDAEAQVPCVLFIDEVDSVFIDRGAVSNSDSEAPKTLNAILTRMVSLRDKGVVLVAATNFIDKLDAASIREGRFDFKMEVTCPDFEARVGILNSVFGKLPADRLDADAISRAARRWEGYSVSRIKAIADEAVLRLKSGDIQRLTFDDLAACLRKIQGTLGDRLPEDTPTLKELVLDPVMRDRMAGIAFRMMNIEQIESMGGSVPNGVLFYGPPGTGKTLGARSLAKTTGWAFIRESGQALVNDPDLIDKMIKRAKEICPCIVFIDEADDILADRRMSPMSKAATNRLIVSMDGAGGKMKDVLFIAATNAPDIMDEAALRGGRFTEKVEFGLPGKEAVSEFVQRWMNESRLALGKCITPDSVSEVLTGQSLANIREILQLAVNETILRMSRDPDTRLTLQDVRAGMAQVSGSF